MIEEEYYCTSNADFVDRGRDTSHELTEVRTVHQRALTAIRRIDWACDHYGLNPDSDAMRDALEQVVALLEPWKRTGRPLKSKEDK